MSLQRMMPVLMALLAISAATMTMAASARSHELSLGAAAAFGLALVLVAWRINDLARWTPAARGDPIAPVHAARRNARVIALVYAWGATSLLLIYSLSGLRWQHGWQYGAGMAIIASSLLLVVHKLGDEGSALRTERGLHQLATLTLAHAIAAAGGLIFLVGAGKLWSGRQDWAANHVFLVGGLTIIATSLIAWRSHGQVARLQSDRNAADQP